MADKRLIPDGIRDERTGALYELIDRLGNIDLTPLLIYIIDNVDSSALPHLAEQFHITEEGWEFAKTEQEKRELIKKAIEAHKHKGTLYAIKQIFNALGLDAEVWEWFEYGGQPYRFKLMLKSVVQDEDTYRKLVELVNKWKNERSWLDSIGIHREYSHNVYHATLVAKDGKRYIIPPHISTSVKESSMYFASAQRVANTTAISVHVPSANVEQSKTYHAGVIRYASYTQIPVGG